MNESHHHWPLWMQLTQAAWTLGGKIVTTLAISAAIPVGLILGLRLLRIIKPMVAQ